MRMKKTIILCAIVALFAACNNHQAPEQTEKITFRVSTFQQSTEPMQAPRRAPIYDEATDGTELTDLYVFVSGSQIIHQTNDDENFGTVTLNLTHGTHDLSFILTRATGITVADGKMTMSSIKSTFGKLHSLQVTNNTPAQEIALDRLNGQLIITIQDAFPTDANEIEFIINPRYSSLDVATLQAVDGQEFTQRVSCTSKIGNEGTTYNLAHLAPSLSDEYTSDVTINVYNASGNVAYTVTVEDVRLAANTRTTLSGKLFTAPGASVSANHEWQSDISISF